MRELSASEWLEVWEHGQACTPLKRGTLLLATLFPERSREEIARLSIGLRDRVILLLRKRLFGSEWSSVLDCPRCGQKLEVSDRLDAWLAEVPAEITWEVRTEVIRHGDWALTFRAPTAADLLSLAADPGFDFIGGRKQLLYRCIVEALQSGENTPVEEIPAELLNRLAEEIPLMDPLSDIQLALVCPECQHHWQIPFDILHYFWVELSSWVQRTLMEVHQLASAYGWRESDILAMRPQRRRLYLEMLTP